VTEEGEEVLTGGGVNEVVRTGDAVRRPTGPHTPRVHDLLRRLADFAPVPRVRGVRDGFEFLDFLPGTVANYPATDESASRTALRSAAVLLRDYHRATAGFASELPRDGWTFPAQDPVEVVCHGDFAPHNCVLDGERVVGLIDFDTARPGPRLTDLGVAVYRWVPLSDPANEGVRPDVDEQAERLAQFCDVYGVSPEDRAGVVDAVLEHLDLLVRYMHAEAAAGSEAFANHIRDGHDELYRADARYVTGHRARFEAALLPSRP
jgi:aminoglycoside phosphotransferase (APT) family kinase protein